MIWGAETAINFTRIEAAPAVCLSIPSGENYVTEEMILDFQRNRAEQTRADHRQRPGGICPFMRFPIESERIDELINKIYAQYKEAAIINGWWVIQLVEP